MVVEFGHLELPPGSGPGQSWAPLGAVRHPRDTVLSQGSPPKAEWKGGLGFKKGHLGLFQKLAL